MRLAPLFLIVAAIVGSSFAAAADVSTDKADYAPGETVTLHGADWAPFEEVTLTIVGETDPAWSTTILATADASGAFVAHAQIAPWFILHYTVIASGPITGTRVSTFTDGNLKFQLADSTSGSEIDPNNAGSFTWTVNWKHYTTTGSCTGAYSNVSTTMIGNSGNQTAISGTGESYSITNVTMGSGAVGYGVGYWSPNAGGTTVTPACQNGTGTGTIYAVIDTPPVLSWTASPSSASNGQTLTFSFSISDLGGQTQSFNSGYPSCGSGTLISASKSINRTAGTFQCTFNTGGSTTVQIQSIDSTNATSNVLSQAVDVAYVSASNSTVSATSPTTADGSAGSTVTITLKDASGAGVSGRSVTLRSSRGATDTITQPAGTTNASGVITGTVKSTTAGTATITATDAGSSLDITQTASIVFAPGAASLTTSTLAASPSTVGPSGTSTLTVTLKDANSNALTSSGGTVTFLPPTSGSIGAVTNNNNGTYTATYTADSNPPTLPITITALLGGLGLSNTATIAFSNANLTTTTVTASPSTLTADGASTSTLTVQLKDGSGASLTASGGTITFASPAAGSIGSVTDNGNGTYTATYTAPTSTAASPIAISASLGGNAITHGATITLVPGAASLVQSTLAASPTTLTPGAASALSVKLYDANGNALTASGGAITFATPSAGSIGSVTDNGNGTYSATYTAPTSTAISPILLTARLAGSALSNTANITMVPGAASLTQSTLSASPASLTADGASTSALTIQLKDTYGNALTASGGAITFDAPSAGSIGSVTDNGNGTYTATFTAPTSTTGSPITISARLGGSALSSTATITLVPGAASLVQSTLAASPTTLAPGATSLLTVKLYDANGNALTASGGTITFATPAAGSIGTVTDNGNGTYTATFTAPTSTAISPITLTARLAGSALANTANVTMIPGTASLTASTLTASPTTLTADGASTSTLTIRLKDAYSNALTASGGAITFDASSAGSIGSVMDNGNGTYTATYTAPASTAGSPITLTARLAGSALSNTANITLIPGAASLVQSTLAASPATLTPGATSALTVKLYDANGNALTASGGTITFATPAAGSIGSVTDNGDGSYAATFTAPSSTAISPIMLTAKLAGSALSNTANVTMIPGAADLASSTLAATPTTLTPGATSALTVRLYDAFGNALTASGGVVTFASPSAGSIGSVTDNGDGSYAATFTAPTSTAISPILLTAKLAASALANTANITMIPGAADLTRSTLAASPATLSPGATSALTVRLYDAYGNARTTGGGTISFATAAAGSIGSVTDNGDGSYSATFTAPTSTAISSILLTAKLAGSALANTANITIIPGAADPTKSVLTASPTTLTPGATSALTVRLYDAFGNALTASGGTITFAAPLAGSIGSVTDHGDGTYAATFTAPTSTSASPIAIASKLDGAALGAPASIALVPGAADVATSAFTATPTSLNGSDVSRLTITLKDAYGNPLTASGGAITFGAPSEGAIADLLDLANGTYQANYTAPGSPTGSPVTLSVRLDGVLLNANVTLSLASNAVPTFVLTPPAPPAPAAAPAPAPASACADEARIVNASATDTARFAGGATTLVVCGDPQTGTHRLENVITDPAASDDAPLTLDLSAITKSDGSSAPSVSVPNALTLTRSSATPENAIQVLIASGTTIQAASPSWDGIFEVPTLLPASSIASSSFGTPALVIEVGSATSALTFDHPVRLIFPGQAGMRVGFQRPAGSPTEITDACDSPTTPTNVPAAGACRIAWGADLVVWTTHMTQYFTFRGIDSTSTGIPAPVPDAIAGAAADDQTPMLPPIPVAHEAPASGGVEGAAASGASLAPAAPATDGGTPSAPASDASSWSSWWWLVLLGVVGAYLVILVGWRRDNEFIGPLSPLAKDRRGRP